MGFEWAARISEEKTNPVIFLELEEDAFEVGMAGHEGRNTTKRGRGGGVRGNRESNRRIIT